MLQLVRKDLYFYFKIFIIYLIIPVGLFMFTWYESSGFVLSCLLMIIASQFASSAIDKVNKSEVIFNSVPLERKDIIIAKYISYAIFSVVGIILTTIIVWMFRGFTAIEDIGAYHPYLYIQLPWYVVIQGIVIPFVYIACVLPSYYGTKSKIKRFLTSGVAIAIGMIVIFEVPSQKETPFGEWIINWSHFGIFLTALIVVAIMYIVSMFIAMKLYEKRDI